MRSFTRLLCLLGLYILVACRPAAGELATTPGPLATPLPTQVPSDSMAPTAGVVRSIGAATMAGLEAVMTAPPPATRPLPLPTTVVSVPIESAPTETPDPFTPRPTAWPAPTVPMTPTLTVAATALPTANPTEPAAAAPTPIGALTLDSEATVAGRITSVYSFAAGFKLTLTDDTGAITLLLWHDVYDDAWDAPLLAVGAQVVATGVVGQFQGERQLTPMWGGGVQVVVEAPPPAPLPMSELAGRVDQYVTVRGTVTAAARHDYGWQITLADETDGVTLFLWPNVAERVANGTALLQVGTSVQVSGWLQLYQSNRQLVPALPHAVVVEP